MTESLNLGRGVRAEDLAIYDHHADPDEDHHTHAAGEDEYWDFENVELTTVGIDIGSSTSHLMFARVHLQRLAQALSSRFVVVRREVLWRSPVTLTPYLPDDTIDAEVLGDYIRAAYAEAGIARGDVDTGAVILTGEALKRRNAQAIAELFAEEGGRFVCASAGHHLEALLAAHGSGAAALSRSSGKVVLNVDIGGGTSKLAICRDGEVLETAAMAVGGRLVARTGRRIVRIDGPAHQAAAAARLQLELGGDLSPDAEKSLVGVLADALLNIMTGGDGGPLGRELLVTDPLSRTEVPRAQVITFSGGVAEYIYGGERTDYDDLAPALADAVRTRVAAADLAAKVVRPSESIRATVIGASQFSVQVSGNTVELSDEAVLPMQNLAVLHPRPNLDEDVDADHVATSVRQAAVRLGVDDAHVPVALSVNWSGEPLYRRLRALAEGLAGGMASFLQRGHPLVVLLDGDIGRNLGHILRNEMRVPVPVVCLDGVTLRELDYVDIGEIIRPSCVVPLVIKSLLFSSNEVADTTAEILLAEPFG